MKTNKHRVFLRTALFILLPLFAFLICLCIGRTAISPSAIFACFKAFILGTEQENPMVYKTIFNIRLPRLLLGSLIGMGLSTAGCSFQGLFSNPLATPDTLGVAGGASFGSALGILLGFKLGGIQITGFIMGFFAVFLTYFAAKGKGSRLSVMVLSGIMIGSLFSALVSFLKYIADAENQLPQITYWLMGSLSSASYSMIKIGSPFIVLPVLVLFHIRWRLNLLPLSEDEARSSGTNINLLRAITVICATMITASAVSMCGQVGWIGLIVPHICRMKFGSNHKVLLPACISLGITFTVTVDTLARSITSAELPISILTAVIGAPFFIVLMRKSGGFEV